MQKRRALRNEYRFPGFYPKANIQGMFGDPKARVITLVRRQKKRPVVFAGQFTGVFTIERYGVCGIYPMETRAFIWMWKSDGFSAGSAGR